MPAVLVGVVEKAGCRKWENLAWVTLFRQMAPTKWMAIFSSVKRPEKALSRSFFPVRLQLRTAEEAARSQFQA
jgi:hypothetical protein